MPAYPAVVFDFFGTLTRSVQRGPQHADTARYVPEDLKPFSFDSRVQMASAQQQGVQMMAATQPGHMAPKSERRGLGAQYKAVKTPDSETTLNGNSVVLEEEMIKMSDARMTSDAAISFYQKSLNLLRMATRPPGK